MEARTVMEAHLSKGTKALLLILLFLISIYSFCFIENQTISYWISAFSLIVLILFLLCFFIRKKIRERRDITIAATTPKITVRISAVKSDRLGNTIVQVLVNHPSKEYFTNLIIEKSKENNEIKYKAGQDIRVYIDPKDGHHLIISETVRQKKTTSKTSFFITFIIIVVSAASMAPAFISMITAAFNHSDRIFQDIASVQVKGKPETIWEVRYKSPDKIYINIYDPLTNKKIKSIKDKKDKEMDYSTDFFIVQQGQKVFIVVTGTTPAIDVYDAITFEKLSEITTFEQANKFFNKGISKIQDLRFSNDFFKDEVFELTTNDGNKCYYNVSKDKFYYSAITLNEVVEKTADELLMRQKFVFALSAVPDAVDKHQLYRIKATDTGRIKTLQSLAGTESLNVDYFNKHKHDEYRYCEIVPLCNDQYFLKGNIIYSDSAMVIIQHATAINKDAEVILSGFDTKGKTLFTIKQGDYPNIEKMAEDNNDLIDYQNLKIIRHDNKIVFLFDKYGGLCIDVKTGEILWKWEL